MRFSNEQDTQSKINVIGQSWVGGFPLSEGLEAFVNQKLPQEEDKHLLKTLIEILTKEGSEAVKDKIAAMIEELKEA